MVRRLPPAITNTIYMYKGLIIVSLLFSVRAVAQADTSGVVIRKDPRIDQLVHKQMEINEETTRDSRRNMPGFRIQVMNTPDRNKVFAAKTKVYQAFPDLKPYLLYQPPNYKLRVGNFRTQEEAEDFVKQLSSIFPSGLYVIRDTIEVTPERLKEEGGNER